MSGKDINFNDKKIKKSIFYKNKIINNIEDIDVNNILVSKNESYGNKNSLRLPQMAGYARKFDENATRSFIVKDKKLLKKYTKI